MQSYANIYSDAIASASLFLGILEKTLVYYEPYRDPEGVARHSQATFPAIPA